MREDKKSVENLGSKLDMLEKFIIISLYIFSYTFWSRKETHYFLTLLLVSFFQI